jgi:MFS family permease
VKDGGPTSSTREATPGTGAGADTTRDRGGIWSAAHRATTIGATGLVFLNAFESLAVTTVMPLVSRELGGGPLYALAFAAPMAVGIVGMVLAGSSADRRGPLRPLVASIVLFSAGLLCAGLAPTMIVLLAGRALQGLGSGGVTVALFVLVAKAYPAALHPRIFGAFAAAWVLPSIIGPVLAGLVAEHTSWRWVFLGVLALVPFVAAGVLPAARAAGGPTDGVPAMHPARALLALGAAAAVLAVGSLAQVSSPVVVPVVALLVAGLVLALRPLLPAGTLRARRGLPSVLLSRACVAAAFFGTEVYVPYLLIERHGLTPAVAGLTLTGAAISWASASQLQAWLGERISHAAVVRVGIAIVGVTDVLVFTAALADWPPPVLFAAWMLGGAGMGFAFPRISTLVLSLAPEAVRGFTTSAMSIVEAVAAALTLAVSGLVFAALTPAGGVVPFAGSFALATLAAAAALLFALRIGGARRP